MYSELQIFSPMSQYFIA